MEQTIYKWDQKFKNMITEAGYKHIAMESADGERIISYNQPKTKITTKFDEIRKRLAVQPDGYYKILCRYNYGNQNKPDTFMIVKGETTKTPLKEKDPEERTPARRKETEDIQSLPAALEQIKELATLRVENESLKKQLADADDKITELEDELNDIENKPLAEEPQSDIGSWFEKTIPQVTPFLEEYFKLQNRKMDLAEKRMQPKKPVIVNSRPRRNPGRTWRDLDITNQDELNSLYDEMEQLPNDKFDEAFETISTQRPELGELIAEEFQLEEEEGSDD